MRKKRSTYKSCSDLLLYNFIQILVHDNKELLYNRPNKAWYKAADLETIWDGIFMEYIELCEDKRSKAVLELMKEITIVNNKIEITQNCINLLSRINDVEDYQPAINILRSYGFMYSFNNESLLEDLQKTAKSAKRLIFERDELRAQLNEINKNDQEKATEKDFSVHLANIESTTNITIRPKEHTVMDYIGFLQVFNVKMNHERTVNT